jgi:hypothetical protein
VAIVTASSTEVQEDSATLGAAATVVGGGLWLLVDPASTGAGARGVVATGGAAVGLPKKSTVDTGAGNAHRITREIICGILFSLACKHQHVSFGM